MVALRNYVNFSDSIKLSTGHDKKKALKSDVAQFVLYHLHELERRMPVLSFNLPSEMDFKMKALLEFFTSRE